MSARTSIAVLAFLATAAACDDDASRPGTGGGATGTAGGPSASGTGGSASAGGSPSGQGTGETSSSTDGSGGAGAGEGPGAGAGTGTGGDGEGSADDVAPPTCVDHATLPAWRQGMQVLEWKRLSSVDLDSVTPTVQPGGHYGGRIDAWNGFCADTTSSVMYLAAAGGHGDYAGNEVYSIDLKADLPQWVLENEPTPPSDYTIDQAYYADGRPSPTHTYYTSWFIEARRKVFRFAGAASWGTGNGGSSHIDSWDPITRDWDPAGTHPDMGPAPGVEIPTAKNILTGDVYQFQNNNHLRAWYAATDTALDLGDAPGGSGSHWDVYKAASAVDPVAGRLVFFSDGANPGAARLYDLAAGTWSVQPFSGEGAPAVSAPDGQAMAYYDVCAGAFAVKTNALGDVFFVDATTFDAVPAPTTGEVPPSAINGVHTLFQYLPALGGYAYQPSAVAGLYFLATQ